LKKNHHTKRARNLQLVIDKLLIISCIILEYFTGFPDKSVKGSDEILDQDHYAADSGDIYARSRKQSSARQGMCVYVCLLLELCQFYIGTGIRLIPVILLLYWYVSVKHVMLHLFVHNVNLSIRVVKLNDNALHHSGP